MSKVGNSTNVVLIGVGVLLIIGTIVTRYSGGVFVGVLLILWGATRLYMARKQNNKPEGKT